MQRQNEIIRIQSPYIGLDIGALGSENSNSTETLQCSSLIPQMALRLYQTRRGKS